MAQNNSGQYKEQKNISVSRAYDLSLSDKERSLDFLIQFFRQVRPGRKKDTKNADVNLQRLIQQLDENREFLQNLRIAILSQLINTDLLPALTESGLLQSRGFVQEFVARLNHKLLPSLRRDNDFLNVINRVFYKKRDYIWIEDISKPTWKAFFQLISFPIELDNAQLRSQLSEALLRLSYKMVHHALEPDVVESMPEEYAKDNPFVRQNKLVLQLVSGNSTGEGLYDCLLACRNCLNEVKEIQSVKGASLGLTYTTLVIDSVLNRMLAIDDAIDGDKHYNTNQLVGFFQELVRSEKRKNSIRELTSKSFGYVAYQIAEHKGEKGNKYIAATAKEYRSMFVSSMWGGLIICFVVIFKKLLSKLSMPPFWHGFTYGVNYAVGFVAIEETHSILATKQPAFTASAVAGSLDTKKNEQPNLYSLAITVARVIRSQTASFVGNLLVVFPVTYLFTWLYELAVKHPLATQAQAHQMLQEQHPWQSMSMLYAANTGVFLFLCGLVAGYVQNKMHYSRVSERMQRHPLLMMTMPKKALVKVSDYTEAHLGSLAGNILLGFLLGMSGIIMQQMFGIPFDIRHITIAAGNAAIAVYTIGFENIKPSYLLISLAGVLLIGFMNFLVSFSLAFIVAVKSRGIRLRRYPEFIRILWHYFKKYPLSFVLPARSRYKKYVKQD